MSRQILYNAKAIYTVAGGIKHKEQLGQFPILENGFLVLEDEQITAVGEGSYDSYVTDTTILRDLEGKIVTPGFIDPHTHLVFGGSRTAEYALKLQGVDYLTILNQGGGILSTVEATRAASFSSLYERARATLDEMLACGVTTIEAKSGYGLDLETERKQLQVVKQLNEDHAIELVATYMGAHAIPKEYAGRTDAYADFVIEEVLPLIKKEKLAVFIDLFCEEGIFELDQSRRILEAANKLGFQLKIHADEIVPLGGAKLAADCRCVSAEHLMQASDAHLEAMAEAGVCAVLLPTTSFHLGKSYARAKRMQELGVTLAMATDYNPGSSPCSDLIWAMRIASRGYHMAPLEILTMVTLHAARAIGKEEQLGSLEPGKQADLVCLDLAQFDDLIVNMGRSPVHMVIKKGKIVYQRGGIC